MGVQSGDGYTSSASHRAVSVAVPLDTVSVVAADNAHAVADNAVAALAAVVGVCVHTQVGLYIFLIPWYPAPWYWLLTVPSAPYLDCYMAAPVL